MNDTLITADASQVSGAAFFNAFTGRPPLTTAERIEKERQAEAYLAKQRAKARAELEHVREGLCRLASPELAAKFRARWAEEDAADERRERRAA